MSYEKELGAAKKAVSLAARLSQVRSATIFFFVICCYIDSKRISQNASYKGCRATIYTPICWT